MVIFHERRFSIFGEWHAFTVQSWNFPPQDTWDNRVWELRAFPRLIDIFLLLGLITFLLPLWSSSQNCFPFLSCSSSLVSLYTVPSLFLWAFLNHIWMIQSKKEQGNEKETTERKKNRKWCYEEAQRKTDAAWRSECGITSAWKNSELTQSFWKTDWHFLCAEFFKL